MESLLLLVVLMLGGFAAAQHHRLNRLQRRVDLMEIAQRAARQSVQPAQVPPPTVIAEEALAQAAEVSAPEAVSPPASPQSPPRSNKRPPRITERPSLESLIGARLPVWIGAIALIVSGFFLVRYAVEYGIIGPSVRTALAAAFALLLIGASEAARRIPAVADDPRIGQALAGAGIASSYGTLYIAAALYALITPLTAFILMVCVTGLALFLALRHGPPTAILALAGGFIAPLVAGYDAAGIGPLLTYLVLLTAALFALAAHRGWWWLALASTALGFVWLNFLLYALTPSALVGPAAFTVLLAVGATLALPRTGLRNNWLTLAPLVAGLLQLLFFLPGLEYNALSWSFYLVLTAATLVLAWRDHRYMPGVFAAALLAHVLLAAGVAAPANQPSLIAAALFAAMFALCGFFLANRGREWAAVALIGLAGPLLLSFALSRFSISDTAWSGMAFVAAGLAAWLSHQRKARVGTRDIGLIGGTLVAAALCTLGVAIWLPDIWLAAVIALATMGMALWARHCGDADLFKLPAIGVAAMLAAAAPVLMDFIALIAVSLIGILHPYSNLPQLYDSLIALLPVILTVAILTRDKRQFDTLKPWAIGSAAVVAALLVYHLLKLPLAIADKQAFATYGFTERAVITQLFLLTAVLLTSRHRLAARALLALGLARLIWFDLLLFNPLIVTQSVGSIPVANTLVLHLALAGFALWRVLRPPHNIRAALLFSLLTTLAIVRQAAQGSVITGPIGTGENYGYSAALLLLALAGLMIGIRRSTGTGGQDLRFAGLALLTLVTLKVFLIDASALDGLLRILSFMGLGIALIGIGWVYRRFLTTQPAAPAATDTGR